MSTSDWHDERLRNLAEVGWLSQQPADFRERIARLGKWLTLSKGQLLYDVGDDADAIFGLEQGLLDVTLPINPDEMATLHRATPGFWIGDSALLADTTRGVRVSAAVDCRVLRIPVGQVRRNLEQHPQDWMCFYRLSHMNVMLTLKTLAEVVSLPPSTRISRLILRLADSDGLIQASQVELAQMVGMSRATFRRAFASLVESGIVEAGYGGLRILDHEALQTESDRPSRP